MVDKEEVVSPGLPGVKHYLVKQVNPESLSPTGEEVLSRFRVGRLWSLVGRPSESPFHVLPHSPHKTSGVRSRSSLFKPRQRTTLGRAE